MATRFGIPIETTPEAIRQRAEAARNMVNALCKPKGSAGSRDWIMSIPARLDYDPDLVIGSALQDIDYLLDLNTRLLDAGRAVATDRRFRAVDYGGKLDTLAALIAEADEAGRE